MTPEMERQEDNLTIGLYLANARASFGATMDDILQAALPYNPSGGPPDNYPEPFVRRFRAAQKVGRDAYVNRTPGYFIFNAMPFGHVYIYKALSYVWINPGTNQPQVVPLPTGDLASMRRLRDRDLDTRQSTNRSIRAADNIHEQRRAVSRRDWQALQEIQSRMIEDGSFGEIISGYYGLPYADVQDIMPQIANQNGMFQFQKDAKDVRELERRLMQRKASFAQQLTQWVMLQTGVPNNAHLLALQQAQRLLASLP